MPKYRGVAPAPQPRLAQLRRNVEPFAADGSLAEDGNAGEGGQAMLVRPRCHRHQWRDAAHAPPRSRTGPTPIPSDAVPRARLRSVDRACRASAISESPDWTTKARVRRTIRRRCSGVSFVRIQLREWIYSCPPTRTWWAQQHAQPSSHSRTGLAVTMARDEPSVAA